MGKQSQKTEINTALSGRQTMVNDEVQPSGHNRTVINRSVHQQGAEIPAGTKLAGRYLIESQLPTNGGEAALYLCTYRNRTYVAKVYRRQKAIKEDVVLALESVDSKNVARLYYSGLWEGAPFEILPYYQYGSLEGRTFSYEQLVQDIIPGLNNGLYRLHRKDIIHKDLKPSNIMLCDDQKNVAIIDFGISSIREDGSTVVVTKTGMTPEYSAPETFRNLFLEESDYYSLGITIYELYTGHTPYSGISKDEIEQYIAIQKLPFPPDFPERLRSLVIGLTYHDITNRKERNNPNRRWTYEEVKRWCKGEDLPLPGGETGATSESSGQTIPAFTLNYKKYTSLSELIPALGENWKNGKRRVYRSLLGDYFQSVDQELASYCMDAVDAVNADPGADDTEYFRLLYRLDPKLEPFYWKEYQFPSMKELSKQLLDGLRASDPETDSMLDEFLKHHLFSIRESAVNHQDPRIAGRVSAIEANYELAKADGDTEKQREQCYLIAYLYSDEVVLSTGFGDFRSLEELEQFVQRLITEDEAQLNAFANEVIGMPEVKVLEGELHVSPQFSAWLIAMGKEKALRGVI